MADPKRVVNPYANGMSSIPRASSYQFDTPELSGIDAESIYGDTSPNKGVTGGQTGSVSKLSGVGASDWAGAGVEAVGIGMNAAQMANQRFHFSQSAASQTDSNSAPSYTQGQFANEVSAARAKGASGGEIASSTARGAAAGTKILPGWGTAIGAVYGAASSIIGGAIRKNKEETQKEHAQQQLFAAQQKYNQQDVAYRNRQNQLYDYYNQENAEGREYNVYKSHLA